MNGIFFTIIAIPSKARQFLFSLSTRHEIASHASDARNDSKKYLIFKWLYQLLDFYRYFWIFEELYTLMIVYFNDF
ncbi:hypothetical protein [Thermodesulfovibrio hydrogeniphilus]